jgi:predicted MPP superfamily phosphohydrolase
MNSLVLLKQILYYGSFAVFPFIAIVLLMRRKFSQVLVVIVLLIALIFIWARFVEPMMIITRTNQIAMGTPVRFALIADTHLGVYKKERFLRRVVNRINKEEVDFVLIAGDLVYDPQNIDKLFEPFGDIAVPVYAVMGNHDLEYPKSDMRQQIEKSLENEGVVVLTNEFVSVSGITIVGLGDRWGKEDDVSTITRARESGADTIIVMAHNPDTTHDYVESVDLTVSGHTHCGQLRIPGLYKQRIPSEYGFDKGYSQEKFTQLYITCGLGEVGLPMRIFNPPVIDVIESIPFANSL